MILLMEEAVARASASTWVRERAKIGDLILIGSRDTVSRVIQRASNSRFSHAAVVTGPGIVIEAYDYSLTLNEEDQGIYYTSFERFFSRTPKLHTVLLLRPKDLDADKLLHAAGELARKAPPYPTVGATFLGFIRLLAEPIPPLEEGLFGQQRFGRRLHKRLDAMATAKVGFVGDDIHKVHCAESVILIYKGAGITINLPTPFLARSADRARRIEERMLRREFGAPEPTKPNPSTNMNRETRSMRQIAMKVLRHPRRSTRSLRRVWQARVALRAVASPNDYIFPGDLNDAECFFCVDMLEVGKDRRWRRRTIK